MDRLTHLASGRTFDVRIAAGPRERIRGLIGAPEGILVIPSRGQVHTFGMDYAIDVVFCDRDWCVVHVARALKPKRVTRFVRKTRWIVEGPAGTFDAVKPGDRFAYESSTDR